MSECAQMAAYRDVITPLDGILLHLWMDDGAGDAGASQNAFV